MKVGKKRANWSIDLHIVCKLAHDAGIIYPGRSDTSKQRRAFPYGRQAMFAQCIKRNESIKAAQVAA
jgi:hypothetical protein